MKTELEDKLKEAGFTQASDQLAQEKEARRKRAIAQEHFLVVTEKEIKVFAEKLDSSKRLMFRTVETYPKVPPVEVLDKMAEAKKLKCLDSFEVCSVEDDPDPIIFGRINRFSQEYYYVTQWDKDVSIEDFIGKLKPEIRPSDIL